MRHLIQTRTTGSGLAAGLLSGLIFWLLIASQEMSPLNPAADATASDFVFHLLLSAAIGTLFGLTLGPMVRTVGSGVFWGVTFGIVWWFLGPLTIYSLLRGDGVDWSIEAAQQSFPLLCGLAVSFGAGMGMLYCGFAQIIPFQREHRGAWRKQIMALLGTSVGGGLAGVIGGLAYGKWMSEADFYPLVAGLVDSSSADVGQTVHLLIAIIIGATFGILFRADIRSLGSSVAWGMAYGILWWILGALTLFPILLGDSAQWSLDAGRSAFPGLVGHIVYGILLGVVYAGLRRIWDILFVESDPLKREPEGPGTRSLRALATGALASIVGGLVFTVVMVETDVLPDVASLIGSESATTGFAVHMTISAIIGATYGLLFRRESYTYGVGVAWGLVYGLMWWLLGPLTLMPVLLGNPLQWSLSAAVNAYPSLIGHLMYGASMALTHHILASRIDPYFKSERTDLVRRPGTPVSALWVLTLVLGVMLPLLFYSADEDGPSVPGYYYGSRPVPSPIVDADRAGGVPE